MSECIYSSKNETFKIEYAYTIDDRSVFYVSFHSEKFRGQNTFFLYESQIKAYISTLWEMYRTMLGGCSVCDCESDSFFALEYETKDCGFQTDGWFLCGQLGATQMGNYLRFRFEVDQTVIKPLTDVLKEGVGNEA